MPEADSAPILADPVALYRGMIIPESGQKPKLLDCPLKTPRSGHYSRRTKQSYGHWAKQAPYPTFQRSLATHPLDDGCDIRTVQELLGHNDVKTMILRAHVLAWGPAGVCSPVDGL